MREIYFCVDNVSYNSLYDYCDTIVLGYEDTEKAINNWEGCIATMSLAHLSFILLNRYQVFLCKGDKKVMTKYKIETDGKYFYPYVKEEDGEWEPINDYYIRNGIIYSTHYNECHTLERAKELVEMARKRKRSESHRYVVYEAAELG